MADVEENIEIIKCGICSDYLIFPKSLTCLHMFCHNCLHSHFSKEKVDLTCPICKTEIQDVNEADISSFIDQLPTNGFIESYINRLRLSEETVFCGPCLSEDKKENAENWCEVCSECLCLECCKVHKKLRHTRSHKVISIHDLAKDTSSMKIELNCRHHMVKILDSYCKQHKCPSCRSCEISLHRNCQLIPIDVAAKDVEISDACNSLQTEITNCKRSIHSSIINQENLLKKLENEKSDAESKIQTLRSEINEHLDQLEQSFNESFQTLHIKTTALIKERKSHLEQSLSVVTNCEKLLGFFVETCPGNSAFLSYHDITRQMEEAEKRNKTIMSKCDSRNKYELTWAQNLFDWHLSQHTLGSIAYKDYNIIPRRKKSSVRVDSVRSRSRSRERDFNGLPTKTICPRALISYQRW